MQRTSYWTGFGLRDDKQAYASVDPAVRESRNSMLHQTTRAVCVSCNNGWMSRLETKVKPIMESLFHSRRTGNTLTLPPAEASTLARWAVKTSWTAELSGLGNQNQDQTWLSPHALKQFASRDVPPTVSWVWLASHQDLDRVEQMQAHVAIDRTSPPAPGEAARRLHASALVINGIVLVVYNFESREHFPPPFRPMHGLRLWPRPTAVEFPPPEVSHQEVTGAIAHYGHWFPLHNRAFDHSTRI
nr:hypothetical protein Ade03nite_09040 [Actinoplanes derwentensis]